MQHVLDFIWYSPTWMFISAVFGLLLLEIIIGLTWLFLWDKYRNPKYVALAEKERDRNINRWLISVGLGKPLANQVVGGKLKPVVKPIVIKAEQPRRVSARSRRR